MKKQSLAGIEGSGGGGGVIFISPKSATWENESPRIVGDHSGRARQWGDRWYRKSIRARYKVKVSLLKKLD